MNCERKHTYLVELTENQLNTINDALEDYFRLPLNQWDRLADRLARKGIDLSRDNPRHSINFDTYILKRDSILEVFKAAGRILWAHRIPQKEEDQLIAEDIWQTIRHELWKAHGSDPNNWTASQPALNLSDEPLPIVRTAEPQKSRRK